MCVGGINTEHREEMSCKEKKKKKLQGGREKKHQNKIKTFLCNTVEFYLFFPSNLLRYGALWNRPVIKYLNHCSTTKCSCISVSSVKAKLWGLKENTQKALWTVPNTQQALKCQLSALNSAHVHLNISLSAIISLMGSLNGWNLNSGFASISNDT